METVLTNLEIPKDLHRELKLIALQQKITVEEILIEGAKEQAAKYRAAREYVKEHFDKHRPVREQVRERVNKYKFSEASPNREKVLEIMKDLHEQGLGFRRIAERLNASGIPTFSGHGKWHHGTVGKLLK